MMKKSAIHAIIIIGCFLLTAGTVYPCTTFVLKGGEHIYFGKNLDWPWEDGQVFINQRHITKTAFVEKPAIAAKWASRYGSVTFNQFGQEMPYGGMNEKGLVIEQMMLMSSRFPEPDHRPAINMLQWIQYQLDNCATVAEVLRTDDVIRVQQPVPPARIHYLVCDARGDVAVIEFIGGRLVSHRGDTLPYMALANNTYDQSLEYLRAHHSPPQKKARPVKSDSLSRFCRAAIRSAAFEQKRPAADVAYAFATLDQVSKGKGTVWQMVYDLPSRRVHYRTQSNPAKRTIDLKRIDWEPRCGPKSMDIQSARMDFVVHTQTRQRGYLNKLFREETFRQRLGDLLPTIEPMLQTLQAYRYKDACRSDPPTGAVP